MSLFPSAANIDAKSSDNTDKDWLQNKSFHEKAAQVLKKLGDENEAHNNQDQPYLQDFEPAAKRSKLEPSDDSESSSGGESPAGDPPAEERFWEDRKMDRNNLYFGKPYKVPTPKFYRPSTNCVGLSPKFRIIFKKEEKRRKKRKKEERYFHRIDWNEQGDLDPDEIMKNKTATLNSEVRETPANIRAWEELVELQDQLGNKNVKFITEKKISILDKAINANPRNVDLKLQRLKLKANISADCDRDWKDLVFKHPSNVKSWEAYINYSKTGSHFTVQKTCRVFAKCFETLSALRNQSFQSDVSASTVERDIMKIFRLLVRFLLEAGRSEQVTAIFLLLIEMNVRTSECRSVSAVKDFYNSAETLLGGGERSKGWERWSAEEERGGWVVTETAPTPPEESEPEVELGRSLSENWTRFECERGMSQLLPWRYQEECDDEQRKVSWDEVGNLLFFVHDDCNKLNLVKMFVNVVGARLKFSSDDNFMCSHPCQFTHAYHSNVPLGCLLSCDNVVCNDACKFSAFPRNPHHEFVTLFFEQLFSDSPGKLKSRVSLVCLSYFEKRTEALGKSDKPELKRTAKEARKTAKNLLQRDPMNFRLWDKFGRIEFAAGRFADSLKIFRNSLSTCEAHCDVIMLCSSFCELFFGVDNGEVLRVLTALGDGGNFSEYFGNPGKSLTGVVTLRVGRSLSRQCEELSCLYKQQVFETTDECPDASLFFLTINCFIIFLQLTKPSEVGKKLREFIEIIRKEKNEGEQANVDLIALHSLRLKLANKDYKHCSLYRNFVLSAVQDCPNHSPFSVQLCQVEVGSSITSVARRIFSSGHTENNLFFSVYFELLRLKRSNFADEIPPRVRNLLERSTKHNSLLMWRLYSKFARNRKDVLLRASVNCPWSKAIAGDRISIGDENEIESVFKFMAEKGIRIRTPIEEIKLLMAM